MKTKLYIIMGALLAGLIVPAGLSAQKVYRDGNLVILDLSVGTGMPEDLVTTERKYNNEALTPSTSAHLSSDNTEIGLINEKPYYKLEVAPNDNKSMWGEAYIACKAMNTGSGGTTTYWRLPTQRELMLMYLFKPAFDHFFGEIPGATTFLNANYWSATEARDNFTSAWYVNLGTGPTVKTHKGNNQQYRCVREID